MNEIALALGGGGVRGIAHIGVIRCLEQAGIKIGAIAGTSAGGLIGSVYSAGYNTDQIELVLSSINQGELFKRKAHDGPSLLGLQGVTQTLTGLLGEHTFEDLAIPFACTAVDLETSLEVILSHGRVIDAVLATIAVPGIFPPMQINGRSLIDGAVLDPVPVALARWLAPKLPVVAVCLSPPPQGWTHLNPLSVSSNNPIPRPLLEQFSRLRVGKAFNIFVKAIDTTARALTELRLEIDKPEVIIRPDVGGYGILDPIDSQELIPLGEQAARNQLHAVRESLSVVNQISRRLRRKQPLSNHSIFFLESPSLSECE